MCDISSSAPHAAHCNVEVFFEIIEKSLCLIDFEQAQENQDLNCCGKWSCRVRYVGPWHMMDRSVEMWYKYL